MAAETVAWCALGGRRADHYCPHWYRNKRRMAWLWLGWRLNGGM